jgi:LacI family transcriptional regulator
MDDPSLKQFCCQNPRCVAYGARGAGNLTVCGRIGKQQRIRLLYCRTCKKRFSERKGTIFYRSHMSKEKVISILQHVQEGNGMRQTGRLVGSKEDTVISYVKKAGGHAQVLHQELAAFSPADPGSAVG